MQKRAPIDDRDPWLAQAFDEVGRTAISRAASLLCVLLFGLILVGVAVAQWWQVATRDALVDLGHSARHAVVSSPPTLSRLPAINRELLAALDRTESRLDEASVLGDWARPYVQRTVTRLGGSTHPGVVRGRTEALGTWLAYRPGVDYVVGKPFLDRAVLTRRGLGGDPWEPPPAPDPRPAIRHFAEALATRGITLLVAPTPTKVMLHPAAAGATEKQVIGLGPTSGSRLHNRSFGRLADELASSGIPFLDLTPALDRARASGSRMFLFGDSHWSPAAVDIAATQIARQLRTMKVDLGPIRRWQRHAELRHGIGDLLTMLIQGAGASDRAREDVVATPVHNEVGAPWTPSSDASVLLLGDSFTGVFSDSRLGWGAGAGLAEQLAFHLERETTSLSVQAGGSDHVRRRFAEALARGAYPNLGVVVWQIAVRELAAGHWPIIELPERQRIATSGLSTRLTATVAARARAPRPGESPYPNALIALHLVDVELDPTHDERVPISLPASILVYTWGLRDGQPTTGERIVIGERITVDLVPWAEVATELGGLERIELADPSLLALDAYWMEAP